MLILWFTFNKYFLIYLCNFLILFAAIISYQKKCLSLYLSFSFSSFLFEVLLHVGINSIWMPILLIIMMLGINPFNRLCANVLYDKTDDTKHEKHTFQHTSIRNQWETLFTSDTVILKADHHHLFHSLTLILILILFLTYSNSIFLLVYCLNAFTYFIIILFAFYITSKL